jgi:GT2 family glycosyltransferase
LPILPLTICVVLTCFNSKANTLEIIRRLKLQRTNYEVDLKIIVVDDGSVDGTSDAIKNLYRDVDVLQGTGSLYWNGGMRIAIDHAANYTPNFFLWLNDATVLKIDALQTLLDVHYELKPDFKQMPIIVGSVMDPATERITYGGSVHVSPILMPLRFRLIEPRIRPVQCDVFNGNCVLVPFETYAVIGNLHENLVHDTGDYEYALRAKKAGITAWVVPGYVGTCTRNSIDGTWEDPDIHLRKRYQLLFSKKGVPPGPRFHYYKSYGGPFWFIIYPLIYLRPLGMSIRKWINSKDDKYRN